MPDLPRPSATSPDQYTLNIEEAAARYEHAGHPRTLRSIQRYCAKGHLDCLRQETTFGDKYLITPESVARHIAQIVELASATHRDMPRPGAAHAATQNYTPLLDEARATTTGLPRQDEPGRGELEKARSDERYAQQLERENVFLREQITVKDAQISELGVRARETNILIKGLQDLFLALNPGRTEPRHSDGETASGPQS